MVVAIASSDSVDASGGDSVDERVALGELLVHPTTAVVIGRSVTVVTFWLFPEIINYS